MPDLIFNRPTDNYVYSGSKVRAGDNSTTLTLASRYNESVIDLCANSNIDISASTLFLNGQIISEGGIQVGSGIHGGRITKSSNAYEIVIDPFGVDGSNSTTQDASGSVVIMGDLIVRGNTTTVYSTNVDISDVLLTLASGSTFTSITDQDKAGIQLGNGYANFVYNKTADRWTTSVGLTISGGLTVTEAVSNDNKITGYAGIDYSGNVLALTNASQLPVTWSTFALKTSSSSGGLPASIGDVSNSWVDATGYVLSKTVINANSFIKIEFKVNYTASPEADQTLSFRVLKSITGIDGSYNTTVFSDISLGSNMGVTFNNVYYGTFIDNLANAFDATTVPVSYKLQLRRDCPNYDTISTHYGIQASSGNYISLQELFRPMPP
uniref:Uncharacterized protein n=1 Tax=viral metagenome TaxID=1070528 RepID=A0A6C0KT85_9ZZZZ